MKNQKKSLLAAAFLVATVTAACLFHSGCVGAGLAAASGQEIVANAYATAKLGAIDPSPAGTAAQQSAVADLGRLATDLPLFAAGKLSFQELGALTTKLQSDKLSFLSDPRATDQINSLLNILATNVNAASNGLVTPQQAIASQVISNVVLGIGTAIQYQMGKWSVTNPSAWATPATP